MPLNQNKNVFLKLTPIEHIILNTIENLINIKTEEKINKNINHKLMNEQLFKITLIRITKFL